MAFYLKVIIHVLTMASMFNVVCLVTLLFSFLSVVFTHSAPATLVALPLQETPRDTLTSGPSHLLFTFLRQHSTHILHSLLPPLLGSNVTFSMTSSLATCLRLHSPEADGDTEVGTHGIY